MNWRGAVASVWLISVAGAIAVGTNAPPLVAAAKLEYDPTSAYRERSIHGWRVMVNEKLLAETNLCAATLLLLDAQLAQAHRWLLDGKLDVVSYVVLRRLLVRHG